MILIVSEEEDYSTSEVIQWLLHYKASFVRVNRGDKLTIDNISVSNTAKSVVQIVSHRHGIINLDSIRAIWYRRGEMHLYVPALSAITNQELRKEIVKHLKSENKIIEDYIQMLLKDISHIGTYETRGVNKLVVLEYARSLGIDIPETQITTHKKHLTGGAIEKRITKCISEVFTPATSFGKFMTYTEAVNSNRLKKVFSPSLFQQLIEKEADIRTFYLQGKTYSMAICSQEHNQTKIDFRKYILQKERHSKYLPFSIPAELEEKLKQLMLLVGLETASIDMVFTKDGRFVFLEANPIGQFSMTSKPCNYFLEREIALALIHLSKLEPV